jgi:hypothetical protein
MKRITHEDIARLRENGYDRSIIANAEALLIQYRRADDLIELVRQAFAGVELGDGIGLLESDGIDDYADEATLAALRASDEKHDWQKIPNSRLIQCSAAPSFLDAKGMRFHVPAFLVADLSGDEYIDIIERLVDDSYSASDFVDLLTPAQRQAIIECIRFYGEVAYDNPEAIATAIARFGVDRSPQRTDNGPACVASEELQSRIALPTMNDLKCGNRTWHRLTV